MSTKGDVTFELDNEDVDEVLQRENFDVIHFHEPWTPLLARQILPRSNAAHVGTFHANLQDFAAGRSFVNVFSPYGQGIIAKMHVFTAVSDASAAVLVNKEPDMELVKNMRYIPNGIDLGKYRPLKKLHPLSGNNTKTIVFIGRLERRKGVDYLLPAFKILLEQMPNAHLVIAGEGNRRAYFEQMVKDQSINNVKFLGYVNDDKKRELIGNADLLCSPAMFGESFGIILIEGMAMGTPTIGGLNNGYASVLTGFGALGMVDASASADFANRMAVFMTDTRLRRNWREWAKGEVGQYDYEKVIDQYELTYKGAIIIKNQGLRPDATKTRKYPLRKIINRISIRRHA